MAAEQFDTHDADHELTDRTKTPMGQVVPITPTRAHLGGSTLLGQPVLGLVSASTEVE
jgi:hypothetical protein